MNKFIKSHFIFLLTGVMVLGFFIPAPFQFIGKYVVFILAAIMVTSFLSIDLAKMFKKLAKPKDMITVFAIVKILIPAGLYFALRPFDPMIALAVLLLSAAPAAATSPTFTKICKGDAEFTTMILVVTAVLSPVTLPLTINLLAGTNISIDIFGMVKTLVQLVVIPLAISVLLKKFCREAVKKYEPAFGSIALILLSILLLGVVAQGAKDIRDHFELFSKYLTVSCIFGVFLALAGWFFFFFYNREKRIGLALSTSYVNIGMIIVLASRYFPVEVVIFALIFEIPANILPGIIKKIVLKKSAYSEIS